MSPVKTEKRVQRTEEYALAAGIKKWQRLGKEYGYPQCCIDFFCGAWVSSKQFRGFTLVKGEHVLVNNAYAGLARAFGFVDSKAKGYIPCPSCLCKKMEKAAP